MKKTILAAALVIAGSFGMLDIANAADGTIFINGNVTDATCNVIGSGGRAGAGSDVTVSLPDVKAASFTAVGTKLGSTPFTITLQSATGGACTVTGITNNKARAFFSDARSVNLATGNLTNMSGLAQGVEVQLQTNDGTAVALGQADGNQAAAATDVALSTTGPTVLTYKAQYISTAATVGSGTVQTSVGYTVSYN